MSQPSAVVADPPWIPRLTATKREDEQKAYELQLRGAKEGAIRWTIYGTILCILGHALSPRFKRQTLAFKGFLVSSAAMSGMTIHAEEYLQKWEKWQRRADDMMRRQAREDLGRQGVIVTESELQKWKAARLQEYEAAKASRAEAHVE